jgi:ribonuclease P protein component
LSSQFTFQKKDKLKSRKQTQFLFAKGQSMNAFPIKLIYTLESNELGSVQTGVGAPSRTFRKAVDRNRVKRLLREGYRLERPEFIASSVDALNKLRVNLFFLYTDATVISQKEIQEKIKQLLSRLSEKINSTPQS